MAKVYRAAAIGSTGKGDFGHGLDVVFRELDGVEFVALADDNPEGLAKAGQRTGVTRLYADYREMLAKEMLDLVSIGPRWTDRHLEFVRSAAEAGCHIFSEKPLASSLAEADQMLDLCQHAKVKLAVAHQWRILPPIQKVASELRAGKYGKLLRMRGRGKEDQRGGGEDLLVLGTHILDLMTLLGGRPEWVNAHVQVEGRDVRRTDGRPASEPVGQVAGDTVSASYGFPGSVHATFDSQKNVAKPNRVPFCLFLECEEATICLRNGEAFIYPASVIMPDDGKAAWQQVWIEDWHFHPNHTPRDMSDRNQRGNKLIVRDLLAAAQEDREPIVSGAAARDALEMIVGVYASHLAGGARVPIPQADRQSPFGTG